LELIKNQLFNPQEYDAAQVHATRYTLYQVGLRLLQMYAPYMPHITETIFNEVYASKESVRSIHQTRFSDVQFAVHEPAVAATMERIVALTALVRKLKTEKQQSLKTVLETLTVYGQPDELATVREQEQLIRGVTQTVKVVYEVGTVQPEVYEINGAWHGKLQY
jgi:valyl-tRNA synthetase